MILKYESDAATNAGRTVGGVNVTHRGYCDGTHTGFASPCNTRLAGKE